MFALCSCLHDDKRLIKAVDVFGEMFCVCMCYVSFLLFKMQELSVLINRAPSASIYCFILTLNNIVMHAAWICDGERSVCACVIVFVNTT